MRLHRWLILIALIVGLAAITGYTLVFSSPAPAASTAQVAADPNPEGFKQLAAPPSDFLSGMLRLPDPAQLGQRSGYAMLPVRLAPAPQGQTGSVWTANVPVDSADEPAMAAAGPGRQRLDAAPHSTQPGGAVARRGSPARRRAPDRDFRGHGRVPLPRHGV